MRFQVRGADRHTGNDVETVIDAPDQFHAEQAAREGGLLVSEVRPLPMERPSRSVAVPARHVAAPPSQVVYATPVQVAVGVAINNRGASGFGIAALVLGIIALLTSWIPFLGMLVIPVALIGGLLAVIGFFVSLIGRKSGVGLPVAGGVACGLAIVVAVLMTAAATAGVGKVLAEAEKNAAAQRRMLVPNTTAPSAPFTQPVQSSPPTGSALATSPGLNPTPARPLPTNREESLVDVQFQKIEKSNFGEKLTFKLNNKSEKTIVSCIGAVHIYDRFGKHMVGLSIEHDAMVLSGGFWIESGQWPISDRTVTILTTQPETASLKFVVKRIAFSDGTQIDFTESKLAH